MSDRHAPHAGPQHHAQPRHAGSGTLSGTWFQRPYPYHLDYYRMRYGGTYEPYYSGGLYGTPQVLVPPAYGYGYGYGYGDPMGSAPMPPGYGPAPVIPHPPEQ